MNNIEFLPAKKHIRKASLTGCCTNEFGSSVSLLHFGKYGLQKNRGKNGLKHSWDLNLDNLGPARL